MRAVIATRRGERGATAVMVAILIVCLFGFAALVIDVGALYQERRSLQNGADAAVLAVAEECASAAACPPSVTGTASTFVDDNADDGDSDIVEVCGAAPGLAACTEPPADIEGFDPAAPPPGASWVRVTASTRNAATGSDQVEFRLAPALDLAHVGRTLRATADAAWGPVGGAITLPLTFSRCEWDLYTDAGTDFASGPPFTGPIEVIRFHSGNNAQRALDCAAQAGQDTDGDARLPGGFGWLENTSCEVEIDAGGWYEEKPGVAPPNSCDPSQLLNRTVLMPIFDDVNGLGGSNGEYHLYGFGAFHVTGFRLGGSAWNHNAPCSPPTNCIGGYFVAFATSATSFGGPNLGAVAVKIVR
jgi:Flp pilus assembly protein TadG